MSRHCEAEYGTKSYVQSSDSEDVDLEQLNIGDSGKRKVKKVLPNLPEFRPSTDMSNPTFQLGLLFPSDECFKQAIKAYALKAGKDIYFKRNEPGRVRAACSKKSKSCPGAC